MVRARVGTVQNAAIGRFELEREVTSDFIGPLWAARVRSGPDAGAFVTIRQIAESDIFCRRTIAEIVEAARWARGLDRNRLLTIRNVVRDQNTLAIVLRPLDGGPMRNILRKASTSARPIPDFVAARVVLDIVDQWAALAEAGAADRGCLFGGITPDSVFIERTGTARLLDVAVSVIAARRALLRRHSAGARYFAPEQLDGVRDERTDVFAIGLLLWEMLAIRRPRYANSFAELAAQIRYRPVPHLRELSRPGISPVVPALCDIVARALDPRPDRRFASPQELAVSISAVLAPATHAEAGHVLGVVRPSGVRRMGDAAIREAEGCRPIAGHHRDELDTAPYLHAWDGPLDDPRAPVKEAPEETGRNTLPSIDIDVDIEL